MFSLLSTLTECYVHRSEERHGGVWCGGRGWKKGMDTSLLSHLQIPKRQVWSKEGSLGVSMPMSLPPFSQWWSHPLSRILHLSCLLSLTHSSSARHLHKLKCLHHLTPLSGPTGLCKVACLHLPPEPAPRTDGRADGGAGSGLGLIPTGQLRMVRSMCHGLPYQAVMSVPFTQVQASCLGLF